MSCQLEYSIVQLTIEFAMTITAGKWPSRHKAGTKAILTTAKLQLIVLCNAFLGDVLYSRGTLYTENSQQVDRSSY
jgi:hypothetical protein